MRDMPDNARDFLNQRTGMVREQLCARGIKDERVLEAMGTVPRERFILSTRAVDAYADRPLPISAGQTISQPYMVAYMTERLSPAPDSKVLEIGTGSGYQTAILSLLVDHVHTIERIAALSRDAAKLLADLGLENITFHEGDGSVGLAEHAPYDRIIITAAAPHVPPILVDQLADQGVLIAPVGGEHEQTIVRVTRTGRRTSEKRLLDCRFVKLIGEDAWPGR
jgi:protein-L-isoaspartate(D-aspartate) O-methyltransferase